MSLLEVGARQWTLSHRAPEPFDGWITRMLGGRLLLLGSSQSAVYDPERYEWIKAGNTSENHEEGFALLLSGGQVLAIGGDQTNRVEMFTLK